MSPLLIAKSLFLWKIVIMFVHGQSVCQECNGCCEILGSQPICVKVVNEDDTIFFYHPCGCPNCMWVNFRNESQGHSFVWNLADCHYGQFNCVDSGNNNTVLKEVLVMPRNMTVHCPNCLSLTACTIRTPDHGLNLSGSFQFNKQLLDGTCHVKFGQDVGNDIGSVHQLPAIISLNDSVDLYSIYILCPICGSAYNLRYYLTRSVTSCHSPPQPTTTFTAISTFNHSHDQSSTFGHSITTSHNDSAIPVTTAGVSQTCTPNMTSSSPTLPAGSIAPDKPSDEGENTVLHPGAIVGIVVGSVTAVVIVLILILVVYWKRKLIKQKCTNLCR